MIKITNEDNMELMARYEDNYFDLAIVDPPYGIMKNSHGGGKKGRNSWSKKQYENIKEAGKDWDKQTPTIEYYNELCRVSKNQIIWGANHYNWGLFSECWVVWDKQTFIPSMSRYEIAYTSFSGHVEDVVVNSNQKGRVHPNQKPVKLYEFLLNRFAKEGDKILDTHLGSGSIAIACHNMKYDLTACEAHKKYYEQAMKRLKEHTAQQRLF